MEVELKKQEGWWKAEERKVMYTSKTKQLSRSVLGEKGARDSGAREFILRSAYGVELAIVYILAINLCSLYRKIREGLAQHKTHHHANISK